MRFLIICPAAESPEGVLGGPVLYRPDLGAADDVTLADALRSERPNAVVTDRALGPLPLREWRRAMPDDPVVVVRCGPARDLTGREMAAPGVPAITVAAPPVPAGTGAPAGAPLPDATGAPILDATGARISERTSEAISESAPETIPETLPESAPEGFPESAPEAIPGRSPECGPDATAGPPLPGITEETLVRALGAAERFLQRQVRSAGPPGPPPHHPGPSPTHSRAQLDPRAHPHTRTRARTPVPAGPESVLLVGAGIVNLVTAQRLQSAGYEVAVVDAGPDPRAGAPWRLYGTSRGGGNARMFTLTEMDDYHAKSPSDTVSPSVFDRTPDDCGWDVRRHPDEPPDPAARPGGTRPDPVRIDTLRPEAARPGASRPGPAHVEPTPSATAPTPSAAAPAAHSPGAAARADAETAWVRDFKSVPPWLARTYNEDIFALNRRSERLWQRWMETRPDLFADVRLSHGILRLYEDPAHLEESARRQDEVGATLARYGPDEIRERFPALAGAVPDAYAGGIMVRGFTVTVHDFMSALLTSLEAGGARLHFGRRADRILRTRHGEVSGVLTPYGVHRATHYVVSPGVTGGTLTRDAGALGQVQGVLGCWASLPDLAPGLGHSLKVGRRGHLTEDANVTLGRDETGDRVLIVGSGYGWTGGDPDNIDERHLDLVQAALADTARRLFPAAYEAAGGEAGLMASRKHCVRPWTASNLGLFDLAPAEDGVLVLTGGHNTGGFAQAPVIAEAVLSALRGRYHPMHTFYHPDRGHRVLGPPAPDPRERQASQ
ncbi:FAD-dependent oxidoreductase [Streptomyces sp. NPDC048718]|uniref:FAD-dependent oxidoreductase n=1 Tax=Streptomyces sp. NPDC048718 TaxID=3365587 RepID=UPI0037212A83